MAEQTDRIEKQVLLRAPLERVWRAVSDAQQFGAWFGAQFDGPFIPGERLTGRIMPTKVDTEVAKAQEAYAGTSFEIVVERLEPMRLFAFRWQTYPPDPGAEPGSVPTTLVAFELREAEGGTLLIITESGFDQVPLERRARAFTDNEQGWTHQVRLIGKYLACSD